MKDSLTQTLMHLKKAALLFDANEWVIVRELVVFLKPFFDVTEVLSASTYPTSNLVCRSIKQLTDRSKLQSQNESSRITNFSAILYKSLCKRTKEAMKPGFFTTAAVFDPRLRDLTFLATAEERKATYDIIRGKLADLLRYCPEAYGQGSNSVHQRTHASGRAGDRDCIFDDDEVLPDQQTPAATQDLLDKYLSGDFSWNPLLKPDHELLLAWWEKTIARIPELKPLFDITQDYLAVPATETESERAFSVSGRILSPSRSSTLDHRVSRYSYIAMNSRVLKTLRKQPTSKKPRKRLASELSQQDSIAEDITDADQETEEDEEEQVSLDNATEFLEQAIVLSSDESCSDDDLAASEIPLSDDDESDVDDPVEHTQEDSASILSMES